MKPERVYLADETGQGVQSKHKQVIGHSGAEYAYLRKTNVQNHNTLMLGICGNDVIKPPTILQQSFPHVGEGKSGHIPQQILLCNTDKEFMGKHVFGRWLENSLIPHKVV